MLDLLKYENPLWEKGIKYIAGVDEVGRGALAGPLVAAAVILNKDTLFGNDNVPTDYAQIKDSKLISSKKREALAKFIRENALSYTIEEIPPTVIDEIGIMGATQLAFFNVIQKLEIKAHHVLTDMFEIKKLTKTHQTNIKRGDNLSISIAAASIVAKVYRDSLMIDLHNRVEEYQKYFFCKHKGYGTQLHRDTLLKYGPCDIHRRCFNPLKSILEQG